MNEKILVITSTLFILSGLGFVGRYLYLDYKSKKEKSFILISLGLLAFWFFGGSTLLIIGFILLALLLFKGCC